MILLLDEPMAGLREFGTDTCAVVSTHPVKDVAAACTEVVLFAEG